MRPAILTSKYFPWTFSHSLRHAPVPVSSPMYTAPEIWEIGDSLAQPMPTYTGPISTAPSPSQSGTSKQTFNQCMAAHATNFSIAGGVDLLFGTSFSTSFLGGLLGGNAISGLPYGSFSDVSQIAVANTPEALNRAVGTVTTHGRRTSTIVSLNIPGKGGLPRALGRSGAAFRSAVMTAGDVFSLGLTFQDRVVIDIGLTLAEAAYYASRP